MTKFKVFLSSLIIAVALSACNQSSGTGETEKKDTSSAVVAIVKDNETDQVYKHYLHLKDELVSSDQKAAQQAGKELASALAKIQGCENTSTIASKIAASDNISDQRVQFTALSSDIIAMMTHTEISSGKLYVQHCPMANEGEGGYWLSAEEQIRNPYYGDEMLECGSVTDTIRAK